MQFAHEGEELQAKAALNEVTSIYQDMLFSDPRGQVALEYLRNERGFSNSTLNKFKIGFAPNGWDFYHHMIEQLSDVNGASLASLEKVGIIKKGKDATAQDPKYYAPFRNRIMFPLMQGNQVIGFTARKLEDRRDENPKYINSGESPLYHKGSFLYNGEEALRSARREGLLFLVEGPTSILQAHQQGIENITASCGTSFTADHLAFINKRALGLELVLCFDADEAGLRAAERKCEELLGHSIQVCVLPAGEDPDSFMRKGYSLQDYAASKKCGAFDFLISRKSSELNIDSPEGALLLVDRLKPTLRSIVGPSQQIYLEILGKKTGLPATAIENILYPKQRSPFEDRAETTAGSSPADSPSSSQIMYISPPRAGWERRFIRQLISSGPDRKVMEYLDETVGLNPTDFGLIEAQITYRYLLGQSKGENDLLGLAGTAMFGMQGLLDYGRAQNANLNPSIIREFFAASPSKKSKNGKNGNGNGGQEERTSTLAKLEESLLMVLAYALPNRVREYHRSGVPFNDLFQYLKQPLSDHE